MNERRNMKVSIITVTYNSAATLRRTIQSVLAQDYGNIEYIVIDGNSSDGTLDILNEYRDHIDVVVSEPDTGIYDAMNKGIDRATGDIVGILNSDDRFSRDDMISRIVKEFEAGIDAVYGDVHFVSANNPDKVVRYYSSAIFKPSRLVMGLSPAHPSFYVKRSFFERYGKYDTSYKIASDFDIFARFFQTPLRYKYMQETFVIMSQGGVSTQVKSKYQLNKEIMASCKKNGIRTNWLIVLSRYFFKLFEIRI